MRSDLNLSRGPVLARWGRLPYLMAMAETVPALIVSGFLGAGKTTLVRYLLEDARREGVRVAVVSNEFGELGIDQALLGETAEGYVELEGGCVCCRLSDELVETLQTLWERVRPERVIVETSGVALPHDVQLNFWREPVSQWAGDDVAVVVVNAEQVAAGREIEGTFEDQVSSADLLLLNKLDLVADDTRRSIEGLLAELAPATPVLHGVRGEVDPAVLFAPDAAALERRRRARVERPHSHEHFETVELSVEEGVASDELLRRLDAERALRIKGFVATREGLRLVQGVGPRIELSEAGAPPSADLVGRLVLIRRS
jgi:cobalamin biosynthesis protein CobW